MRKAPPDGLSNSRHPPCRRRELFLAARDILCALAVVGGVTGLPTSGLEAQGVSPARVEIEFLSDGRCEVSSAGDGFRSHAIYMPTAGSRQTELHCAMPPVSSGQTVALVVSLPLGSRRPGATVPPLEWVPVQGRWVGTAQLTKWPGSIVVVLGGGWLAAGNIVTAAVTIFVIMIAAALATYSRRSRLVKPSS